MTIVSKRQVRFQLWNLGGVFSLEIVYANFILTKTDRMHTFSLSSCPLDAAFVCPITTQLTCQKCFHLKKLVEQWAHHQWRSLRLEQAKDIGQHSIYINRCQGTRILWCPTSVTHYLPHKNYHSTGHIACSHIIIIVYCMIITDVFTFV